MLYILSKGLVALNSRVISGGAVWGEDFVLSDANLIHPVRGFALTYLEVLCLTRANFMKVRDCGLRQRVIFLGEMIPAKL